MASASACSNSLVLSASWPAIIFDGFAARVLPSTRAARTTSRPSNQTPNVLKVHRNRQQKMIHFQKPQLAVAAKKAQKQLEKLLSGCPDCETEILILAV